MKLTTKQKIEWIQHRDFTGILQYCTQAEQLACYPALLKSYRAGLRAANHDELTTALTLQVYILHARLVKQYGRKVTERKMLAVNSYIDRKYKALYAYTIY